jgi:glucokinase
MADPAEVYIGLDIGGTKVAAGLVNTQGEILHKTRTPMHARGTSEEALGCVRVAIDAIRQEHPDVKVGGIGLISPGPVDPQTGMVLNPANLPCWHNYPLADEIQKAYELPTHVHNDANAAGLAEALWGADIGYKCMFYATLGTGVGTAITYNAQLCLGRTGAAGEGGHMSIDHRGVRCRCGKAGCIETFAAGWAIAARAQEKLAREATRGKRIVELQAAKWERSPVRPWRKRGKRAIRWRRKCCARLPIFSPCGSATWSICWSPTSSWPAAASVRSWRAGSTASPRSCPSGR